MTKDQVLQILRAISEEFAAAGRDGEAVGPDSMFLGRLAQAYGRAADLVDQIDLKASGRRRRRRTVVEAEGEVAAPRRGRRQAVPFK